jgi:hypothetical protein
MPRNKGSKLPDTKYVTHYERAPLACTVGASPALVAKQRVQQFPAVLGLCPRPRDFLRHGSGVR